MIIYSDKTVPRYPAVLHFDELSKAITPDQKGTFIVEEKIDGSQFRFGIRDGKFCYGSKSVDFLQVHPADKMFETGVESVCNAFLVADKYLFNFADTITFFGEYLKKPQHNALRYDRVPKNNIIIFDIFYQDKFLPYTEKSALAEKLGFETVPLLAQFDNFPKRSEVEQLMEKTSILGGEKMEGVVIKNYDIPFLMNGKVRPIFYKYVRDEFKEINSKNWKINNPQNPIEVISGLLNKDAIFRKAVQHLKDSGKCQNNMRDMVELINLVEEDLEKEFRSPISDALYNFYSRDIKKMLMKGLPEYYKKILYDQTEKLLNRTEGALRTEDSNP